MKIINSTLWSKLTKKIVGMNSRILMAGLNRGGAKKIVGDVRKFHQLHRDKNITASIVADSVSAENMRILTYELFYPRFIHAEFMTHRLFSRNAASSRAIPVQTQLKNIRQNMAHFVEWGANQSGMQSREECTNLVKNPIYRDDQMPREDAWAAAGESAIQWASAFDAAGYHKQIVNRITEPFSHIKVVCTATEFDNFFHLRCHPDAQPEIQELANIMFDLRESSTPRIVMDDDWHLPYVTSEVRDEAENYLLNSDKNLSFNDLLLRVSASCCAQVSYRKNDTSIEKAIAIYDKLVPQVRDHLSPVHASPFEHQATPISSMHGYFTPGITHSSYLDGSKWSGNFKEWIQYRQLIPNHDYTDNFRRK